MALTIVTWRWGTKYGRDYVDKLARGIARHLFQPYRFIEINPDPNDPLLLERGCLVRLRMFDPEWQRTYGITGRLVCIDLDVVITGNLDPLFDRRDSFVILKGANSINPCPFNGSLMMIRAGFHSDIWSEFTLARAYAMPFFKFPDDQSWIWHRMPQASGWQCGPTSGVWSFRKRGWPMTDELPAGARMVCFPGAADPQHVAGLPWMQRHWQ